MSFTKITDQDIQSYGVQSQPTKLTGTAAQNKAVFDQLISAVVKERFNALIDELCGAGAAAQIGVDTVSGITADTLQEALEAIMQSMQDITQGSVADGSISTIKLADAAVTAAKIAAGGVGTSNLAAGAVTGAKIDDGAVTTAKIALLAITAALLADGAVTTDKLASLAVTEGKIGAAAVSTSKLAEAAVTAVKIAAGAVTAAKIAAGAVTAEKLGSDVNFQSIGLSGNQVRPIFVVSAAPVSGATDGIYLIPEE